jgi:hypothetical protein
MQTVLTYQAQVVQQVQPLQAQPKAAALAVA